MNSGLQAQIQIPLLTRNVIKVCSLISSVSRGACLGHPVFRMWAFKHRIVGGGLSLLRGLAVLDATIVKKGMLQALRRCRPHTGIDFQHVLQQVPEKLVLLTPLVVDQVVQQVHVPHVLAGSQLLSSSWPPQPHSVPLHIHLLFFVASLVQLVINLCIITVLSHVEGDWATLLLDHSQVLYVLVSVEEKLPCV